MVSIPLSKIKEIEELQQQYPQTISLAQGALRLGGIPQEIKDHIKEICATDKTDYYSSYRGLLSLRENIAVSIAQHFNNTVARPNILITHGCVGALSLLFSALLEPGDDVIIPEPAYPAYYNLALLNRASVVTSSLRDNAGQWTFKSDEIKSKCSSKTKIIVFSNPSNPLGLIAAKDELLNLAQFCEERKIYLIIDEAYKDYVFQGQFYSSLEMINHFDYVVSTHTFSKNFAMSGWRVGFMVATEKLISQCARVQDALLNCVNNVGQYAALYALKHMSLIEHFHKTVKDNRDFCIETLRPLQDKKLITLETPVAGFFLFIKTHYQDTYHFALECIKKAGVSVVPGEAFGQSGKGFIRICYARDMAVLSTGIDRLTNFIDTAYSEKYFSLVG